MLRKIQAGVNLKVTPHLCVAGGMHSWAKKQRMGTKKAPVAGNGGFVKRPASGFPGN